MKKILGLATIAFFVALAVIVGYRLSADSMAVVVGVVCGVVASIPMSGLILLITQRKRQAQMPTTPRWEPYRDGPPVVVIQGSQPIRQQPVLPAFQQQPTFSSMPRDFRIIGGEWVADSQEVVYENGPAMV